MKKKVFVFFPDGVGLRNFAFTDFKNVGETMGFDITYWNNTIFSLKDNLGFNEVKIEDHTAHPLLPLYSRARKRIELNISQDKFNDSVYPTYKFPFNYKGFKNALKSIYTKLLISQYNSEKGVVKLREKINTLERATSKYKYCKAQLEAHKPDLVFCTTQRATQSISALLAAIDLGIPTVAFVYSWDNVPKAMQVVETDYYFVWSDLMKQEVLVDFTPRYDAVIEANKDIIEVLDPIWKQIGSQWNQVLPTPEDFKMLYNVCEHTEFVTNVCSSTVFDFVAHNKPCIYYNYEQPQLKKGIRDIGQNYKYVHFRSMPSSEAAVFCTEKNNLETLVKQILDDKLSNVEECKKWYEIIAGKTPTKASETIWKTIDAILK